MGVRDWPTNGQLSSVDGAERFPQNSHGGKYQQRVTCVGCYDAGAKVSCLTAAFLSVSMKEIDRERVCE